MVYLTDNDVVNVIRAERKAATEVERERCARIADIIGNDHGPRSDAHDVAAAIRSLKE